MQIRSIIITGSFIAVLSLGVGCSKKTPLTAPEYTQGNCVGMVRDAAGAPVRGASVMLVPESYSPFSPTAGSSGNDRIDSTISDEYGRFGFDVSAPGAYNLLAAGKGLFAMRRPIRMSADARVILDDEILREPGSLSGIVHLEGASDHRAAVILFMGTNVYAKPSDSTGAFSVAALAQGSYGLRILTIGNDYAVVETTITIASRMHTTLPCIDLHRKFIPIIDSLSVRYDPVMMRVTLTWPAVDTAKIKWYAIYCNRSTNVASIATVGKSAVTRSFDLVTSPIDTFNYQISAIGNDGNEGPSTAGKPFVNSSAIVMSNIIPSVPVDLTPYGNRLCFDRKGALFILSAYTIVKLDSNGVFQKEFFVSSDTSNHDKSIITDGAQVDTAGNLYALVRVNSNSVSLIKINNDLQLVREFPIEFIPNLNQNCFAYSIAVSAAGAFMVNVAYCITSSEITVGSNIVGYGTQSRLYDPQFNVIKTDTSSGNQYIVQSVISNDTITGFVMNDINDVANHRGKIRIVYYTSAFKEISSPVTLDINDNYKELASFVPSGASPYWLFLGLKDLFAVRYEVGAGFPSLLLFFDNHLQPVARAPFDRSCYNLFFDSKGNAYCIPETEKNTIIKYSMAAVLKARAQ